MIRCYCTSKEIAFVMQLVDSRSVLRAFDHLAWHSTIKANLLLQDFAGLLWFESDPKSRWIVPPVLDHPFGHHSFARGWQAYPRPEDLQDSWHIAELPLRTNGLEFEVLLAVS